MGFVFVRFLPLVLVGFHANRPLCFPKEINGYTVKYVLAVGTKAPSISVSIIKKYSNRGVTAYFSIDIGLKINYVTMAGATAVVTAVCVAVPYISPIVAKAYGSAVALVSSYKAFITILPTLVSTGLALSKAF